MNLPRGKTNSDTIGKCVLSTFFINGRNLLFVVFMLMVIIYPQNSLAHEENQPPFLKIANQLTDHYKIRTLSAKDFILPQDSINKVFLVGEEIPFTIDVYSIALPKELKYNENILWDFGDGTQDIGFATKHTYKLPGSYFITIKSRYVESEYPVLIESLFINIVPSKSYHLPQAEIIVNGYRVRDGGEIVADFSKPISLSTSSIQGVNPLSYYWDLGDGTSADNKDVTIHYQATHYVTKPIIRVRDANGLIADFSVKINNALYSEKEKQSKEKTNSVTRYLYVTFILIIIVAILLKIKRYIDK